MSSDFIVKDVGVSSNFIVKDSGARQQYESGMQRDTAEDKPRFDLIMPEGQRYEETLLCRLATHMRLGAKKYGDRNWEKANGPEELNRFKSSAFRHFMQWYCGETDEDHMAATVFNLNAYECIKAKIDKERARKIVAKTDFN